LDINHTEKILTGIKFKPINHNYSDKDCIISIVPSYSIEEIIAEKLRSLIQRNRPRDIYDLWFLLSDIHRNEYSAIKELMKGKCNYKSITFSGIHDFIDEVKGRRNKREWQSSLNNHLPEGMLPDFDEVYGFLKQIIEEILRS
jgi:predicted nucleotidyltransferase component of viral defense system